MGFFMDETLYVVIHVLMLVFSVLAVVLSIVAIASLKNTATLYTNKPKTFKVLSLVLFGVELFSFTTSVSFFAIFSPSVIFDPNEYVLRDFIGLFVITVAALALSLLAIILIQIAVCKSAKACAKKEMLTAQGITPVAQPQYTAPVAPAVKLCSACLTQNSAQSRFCKGCGKELL